MRTPKLQLAAEQPLTGECSVQFSSVAQSCLTLQSHGLSTPGFPVLHHLLELAQTYIHRVGDTIQPFHPPSLSSPATSLAQ